MRKTDSTKMPIFEYICSACNYEFETLQGIKENPLTDCPVCLESSLQKKLSAAAFHLKGTGWYETDFKNSGKSDDKSKKSSDEEQTSKADASDSDAKKTEPPQKSESEKSKVATPAAT